MECLSITLIREVLVDLVPRNLFSWFLAILLTAGTAYFMAPSFWAAVEKENFHRHHDWGGFAALIAIFLLFIFFLLLLRVINALLFPHKEPRPGPNEELSSVSHNAIPFCLAGMATIVTLFLIHPIMLDFVQMSSRPYRSRFYGPSRYDGGLFYIFVISACIFCAFLVLFLFLRVIFFSFDDDFTRKESEYPNPKKKRFLLPIKRKKDL